MRWGGRIVSLHPENLSRPTSCPYEFPNLLRRYEEIEKICAHLRHLWIPKVSNRPPEPKGMTQ